MPFNISDLKFTPSSMKVDEGNLLDDTRSINKDVISRMADREMDDLDVDRTPYLGPEENLVKDNLPMTNDILTVLQQTRAENQSALEQAFNAFVMQGFVGIGLLGAAEGFADLYDIVTGAAWRSIYKDALDNLDDGSENFSEASDYMYRNALSSWIHGKKEDLNQAFPVYSEKEYTMGSGGLWHWDWYMQNLPSIFSFLSFAIPSTATAKGLSYVGKGLKALPKLVKATRSADKIGDLARAEKGLATVGSDAMHVVKAAEAYETARAMETADVIKELGRAGEVYKGISQNTGGTFELLTSSILGTHMANQMFARDIAYQKERELREAFLDEETYQEVLKNNPSLRKYENDPEQVVKILANRAATRDWEYNIITGAAIPAQYAMMRNWWKGAATRGTNRAIKGAAREAAENFAKGETKAAIEAASKTKLGKISNFFKDSDFSWGSNYRGYFDAAWGNAVNVIAEKEADYDLNSNLTGENSKVTDRLPNYFIEGRLWDAAVWGLVGGMFSNAVGTFAGNIKNKYFDKQDITEEQARINNINSWEVDMRIMQERMNRIINNDNIYEYQLDDEGKPILNSKWKPGSTTEDQFLFKPITNNTEKEILLKQEFDTWMFGLVDKAASNGNLDLVKAFLKDKNVIQSFVDNGVIQENDKEHFVSDAMNLITEFESIYGSQMSRLSDLGIAPAIAQIIGSENTNSVFKARRAKELADRYNSQIEDEIAHLKENKSFNENDFRNNMQEYRLANIITILRQSYRARLNDIEGLKGLDYEVERRRLKKVIDAIENNISDLSLSDKDLDFINTMSRMSYRRARDAEGNFLFEVTDNEILSPKKEAYKASAEQWISERIKSIDDEIERKGFIGNLEKRRKQNVESREKFANQSSKVANLVRLQVQQELKELALNTMIDSTDDTIIQRANEIFAKVDAKAKEQVDNSTKTIYEMMNKYDIDEVYDYINNRTDAIKDITEEDKAALDQAVILSGLADERFDNIIFEIADKYDNLKRENMRKKERESYYKEHNERREQRKALEHAISPEDVEINDIKQKNSFKVGDTIVFDEYIGMELSDESIDDYLDKDVTSKNSPAKPNSTVKLKGKIVSVEDLESRYYEDEDTGEKFTVANHNRREQDSWLASHPNFKFVSDLITTSDKVYTVELSNGDKTTVSSNNITHASSTPVVATKSRGNKKGRTRNTSKRKITVEPEEKQVKSPSTGVSDEYTGNRQAGGFIEVGDTVAVFDLDGNYLYEGEFLGYKDGDAKIKIPGKARAKSVAPDLIARKDGFIPLEESLENHEDPERDAIVNLAITEVGSLMNNDKELMDKMITGTLTADDYNDIIDRVSSEVPTQNEEGEEINIDQKVWKQVVEEYVSEAANITINSRHSTLDDLKFVTSFTDIEEMNEMSFSPIYKAVADRLISEYIAKTDNTNSTGKKIVDAVGLLNYMYIQTRNMDNVITMYEGLKKYFKAINTNNSEDSNIVISTDVLNSMTAEELERVIRGETINDSETDIQKFSIKDLLETEGVGAKTKDVLNRIDLSKGFNIKSSGDGIKFYSVDGTYIGALPKPVIESKGVFAGKFVVPTDSWNVDVQDSPSMGGIYSEFLEEYVDAWFRNTDGNHQNFIDILADWIALTVDQRKNLTTEAMNIADRFQKSDEYISASKFWNDPKFSSLDSIKRYEELETAAKRLDGLRKIFQYRKGFQNITNDFGLYSWRDKLYNSAKLLIDVYNNPSNYEAIVAGINPGRLAFADREDRGFASERIAGYNENPNNFHMAVGTSDGIITVGQEILPQHYLFAKKGNTYCVLPYEGAGLRAYAQAYPVSITELESQGSSTETSKQAISIVSDIKRQLHDLLSEKIDDPSKENYERLKEFMLKVFWNRQNWDPTNRTAYSLFRLSPEAASESRFKYLTVTDRGDNFTLSAGNKKLVVYRDRHIEGENIGGANTISLNGLNIGPENIDKLITEIDNLFNNISYDVNINFIKNDGSINKNFGNSLVSTGNNGEFIVNTGLNTYTFPNYSRFLMDGQLVTFRTKITPSGTNYIQTENDAKMMGRPVPDELTSPKINVKIVPKITPVESIASKSETSENINLNRDLNSEADAILSSDSDNMGYDLAKLIAPDLELNDLKLLFPEVVKFDEAKVGEDNAMTEFETDRYGNPLNPIVYLGKTFRTYIGEFTTPEAAMINRHMAVKKLMHEKLHYLFNLKENNQNIANIQDIYDEFKQIIESNEQDDIIQGIVDSLNKKGNDILTLESYKSYLKDALFEDENHTVVGDVNASKLLRLEEFLVESLSNESIMEALNSLQTKNPVGKSRTNLWKKLMNAILNLFGINVKEGSLLEKEFNTLKSGFRKRIINFEASENINSNNEESAINIENNNEKSNNNNVEENPLDFLDSFISEDDSRGSRYSTLNEIGYSKDDYIDSYPSELKKDIKSAIDKGYIKFKCS